MLESKQIFLPAQLTEYWADDFIQCIVKFEDEPLVDFNFSFIEFAKPFGTLLIAEEIKRFVKLRKSKGLKTRAIGHKANSDPLSYLRHIGFFKFIGLDVGNSPGEAVGSLSYTPIEEINIDSIREKYNMQTESIGQVVQNEGERLASIILGLPSIKPNNPVSYCFTEIIRNVFEHGKTSHCCVSAQKYKNKRIEIAIIDRGVGLKNSLAERFNITNSRQAIELGMSPGVSRVEFSDDDDPWHNSGYGLYMLSQLAIRTGSFFICSGKCSLRCFKDFKKWKYLNFDGTAIKLEIIKHDGMDIRKLLTDIRRDGEMLSKVNPRASASSGFY
ncbi:hypothetical protein K9F62_11310 [Desulfovibrio sp. JY]|nr:hypothetical protein K9F62_11310 [Desulfovibrio sp. JY]